jgi:hypothetical protein
MNILIIALTILVISAMVSAFIKVVHYSIGEPVENEKGFSYKQGRILGFYGAFILKKHAEYDDKEKKRLQGKFEALQKKREITNIDVLKINTSYRPSRWLALGVCPVCFSMWMGLVLWLVILPLVGINLLWIFLALPTSTLIISRL